MKQLFQLFAAFFKIGLFTFGGGLAMLPLIQRAAVDEYKWLTAEEMVDCIAIAQSMPGVIAINSATYIGNKQRGFLGALFATLGVILPSFMIIIFAVLFLEAIGENKYVSGAFAGVKAASCALILLAAWSLGKQVVRNAFAWIVAIVSFVLIAALDVNAIWAIVAGAVSGCIYQAVEERRRAR